MISNGDLRYGGPKQMEHCRRRIQWYCIKLISVLRYNIITLICNWEVYIMFSWETQIHDFVIDF